MKRFILTLFAAAACAALVTDTASAQFRSRKSGGSSMLKSRLSGSQKKSRSGTSSGIQSPRSVTRKPAGVTRNLGSQSPVTSSRFRSSTSLSNLKSSRNSKSTTNGSVSKNGLLSQIKGSKINSTPLKQLGSGKSLKTAPGSRPGLGNSGLSPKLNTRLNGNIGNLIKNKAGAAIGGKNGLLSSNLNKNLLTDQKWHNVINHIRNRRLNLLHKDHWCHNRPAACHWWVGFCRPIANCTHHELITCNWGTVSCCPIVHVGTVAPEVRWYLGLKGILLPGQGLGIEAVEPGSPAALVGLQPGMVLTHCNGIEMTDESAMAEAIRISGGVLNMTLLSADGTQVLEGTVQMTRLASVSI